jgi:predicted Zn-dependent protease
VPSLQSRNIRDLRSFIISQWGANLGLRQVERIIINRLEAYTGTSRVRTKDGIKDIRLIAMRGQDGLIFRFAFLTPPNLTASLSTVLRHTTYSFRRLSAAEAAAVRPLRIKVIPVKAGDTVQSLSARQPLEQFRREWFGLINGIGPNQQLRLGQLIKIISE